jgi:hypothetical protein
MEWSHFCRVAVGEWKGEFECWLWGNSTGTGGYDLELWLCWQLQVCAVEKKIFKYKIWEGVCGEREGEEIN